MPPWGSVKYKECLMAWHPLLTLSLLQSDRFSAYTRAGAQIQQTSTHSHPRATTHTQSSVRGTGPVVRAFVPVRLLLLSEVVLLCVSEQAPSVWLILHPSAGRQRYQNQTKSKSKLRGAHEGSRSVRGCAGACGSSLANNITAKQRETKAFSVAAFCRANIDEHALIHSDDYCRAMMCCFQHISLLIQAFWDRHGRAGICWFVFVHVDVLIVANVQTSYMCRTSLHMLWN